MRSGHGKTAFQEEDSSKSKKIIYKTGTSSKSKKSDTKISCRLSDMSSDDKLVLNDNEPNDINDSEHDVVLESEDIDADVKELKLMIIWLSQ